MKKPKVLIADDDSRHRDMLRTILNDWGYDSLEAADGIEALEQAEKGADMVLLDVRMPRMDGLAALPELKRRCPRLPVILMTAFSDISAAVEAMRDGAWDYLTKPLDFAKLQATLANAAEKAGLASERPDNKSAPASGFPLLGNSAAMRELEKMLLTVAPSEATLLITGESGTGKELAARAAHNASRRAGGPFVAINCGAFTESLLASELFGHEKGSFTGADKRHDGLFRQASGGSIFLDEIGEMPLAMQVRLLRVIQEKEVLRVGGLKPEPVDCRVIAATNRDLAAEVAAGRFREDLYYRLNVVSLHMPPLRERNGDVPLLANHFANRFARINDKRFLGITGGAMRHMEAWRWPGNVRELENVMERAIILMPGEYVGERELPARLRENLAGHKRQQAPHTLLDDSDSLPTLEEVEKQVILETLKRLGNNKTEAAKALGITRKTLHSKLNKYRLEEDGAAN